MIHVDSIERHVPRLRLFRARALSGIVCLLSLLLAAPAMAGTICGTVRDISSGNPIPNAGVFLRATNGTYTGIHTATNFGGQYCLDPVPPGNYDLEFRVDNYVVDYVRGVTVNDSPTDVDAGLVPALRFRVWPNPASDKIVVEFFTGTSGAATIEIFDPHGRRVRTWSGNIDQRYAFSWNFRDGAGRPVPSGVYYARASSERGSVITKITRVK